MRRNDLISKAEVLETYAELYDIFDDNAAIREELHKVYAKINSLKELEAAQQWISVNDRLPEKSGTYLCYQPNATAICALNTVQWSAQLGWMGKEVGSWIEGIEYWMPLPEPPKAVKWDER